MKWYPEGDYDALLIKTSGVRNSRRRITKKQCVQKSLKNAMEKQNENDVNEVYDKYDGNVVCKILLKSSVGNAVERS